MPAAGGGVFGYGTSSTYHSRDNLRTTVLLARASELGDKKELRAHLDCIMVY
jgi:hypothetical protein